MPKVSIILPVFDAERHLAMALASLLVQSHRHIDIIAIDDGSRDRSARLLAAAADLDPRVSVLSRPNRGLIATLNEGLHLADSDFVARMDADDIAYPDRIAAQLAEFATDPALGVLGTNFDTLFAPDRLEPAAAPILTKPGERGVLGRFVTSLRHPTVMFRRTRLGSARLVYDPAYPSAEDFDLFRRLAEATRIAQTPLAQLAYRLHTGSVTARRLDEMVRTHIGILSENLHRHYPQACGTGFEAIATAITPESVAATAALVARLDAMAPRQPTAEREAFDVGVTTTFYFFYAHICRSARYELALRFVDLAHRWRSIRRRERMLLKAAPAFPVSPAFALFEQGAGLRRRLQSQPVTRVIPQFPHIEQLARRIESVAQIDPARTKAA